MQRCSFCAWIPMLPWPVWPLAWQCQLGQNAVVGSMTLRRVMRANIATRSRSGPPFSLQPPYTTIWCGATDLGYRGIKSDYRGEQIDIPTRKPRKSQKHPSPQLSDEHKAANTALSRVRIFIEHAIGGMKRYNILVHTFRNRIEHFEDDVVGICAGLWNLVLSY